MSLKRFLRAPLLCLGWTLAVAAPPAFAQGGSPAAAATTAAIAEGDNWRVEVRATAGGAAVFAVPKADPSLARPLCETVSVTTTRVFLGADDDVLLVESGSASLGTSLRVFGLTEGTEFLEDTGWDINTAMGKARAKAVKPGGGRASPGRPAGVRFVAWSADGNAALLRAGAGPESWFAVADFQKHTLSASLERLNRRPPANP